ncbi:MAG TPA: molybdenum cofactor guanylyltransferase MobA [Rhizomicrobium sp.]
MKIAGLILAGGTSRRMGGTEKAFLSVGGAAMLTRIVYTLVPQCGLIAISANGDPQRFTGYGFPVIADRDDARGPMAGLADALDWFAAHQPTVSHVLSVPSDTPFLPVDLAARLAAALQDNDAFCVLAASGGRSHPVVGLWPLHARTALHVAIMRGDYSFHAGLKDKKVAQVEWGVDPVDPFFNVNTPEDFARANTFAG